MQRMMIPIKNGASPIMLLRNGSVWKISTLPARMLCSSIPSGTRVNFPVLTPRISATKRWESSWMTVPGKKSAVMADTASVR